MNAKGNSQWTDKFNELIQACQVELKKTTQIGMKMLSASHSNTQLKESYEELGRILYNAISDKSHSWENEEVHELVATVTKLKEELHNFETDVQNIKKEN